MKPKAVIPESFVFSFGIGCSGMAFCFMKNSWGTLKNEIIVLDILHRLFKETEKKTKKRVNCTDQV